MSASSKLIVVIGCGPGIGLSTAKLFASKGFSVALLSRNESRLKDEATKVQEVSTHPSKSVHVYAVDVGDSQALKETLESKVQKDLGTPEVVFYNAARVAPSKIGEESEENIINDFKTTFMGLYTSASWAKSLLPAKKKEDSSSHPSFLITGGLLWEHPFPDFAILSMLKAAQVNFAGSLAQVLGPEGVHVATVSVGGVVKDDDPVLNATNIATKFWALYEEDKSQWQDMVRVGY